jgi:hypothetical protein
VTLEEFLEQQPKQDPSGSCFARAQVEEPGFNNLYVRYRTRLIGGKRAFPVLDLVNMDASVPGAGAFTRLVSRLRETHTELHLYVENVGNERFARHLLAAGFEATQPACYVLSPCGSQPGELGAGR